MIRLNRFLRLIDRNNEISVIHSKGRCNHDATSVGKWRPLEELNFKGDRFGFPPELVIQRFIESEMSVQYLQSVECTKCSDVFSYCSMECTNGFWQTKRPERPRFRLLINNIEFCSIYVRNWFYVSLGSNIEFALSCLLHHSIVSCTKPKMSSNTSHLCRMDPNWVIK